MVSFISIVVRTPNPTFFSSVSTASTACLRFLPDSVLVSPKFGFPKGGSDVEVANILVVLRGTTIARLLAKAMSGVIKKRGCVMVKKDANTKR
jgi:hypothetical protein